jgi:hypothetical protein
MSPNKRKTNQRQHTGKAKSAREPERLKERRVISLYLSFETEDETKARAECSRHTRQVIPNQQMEMCMQGWEKDSFGENNQLNCQSQPPDIMIAFNASKDGFSATKYIKKLSGRRQRQALPKPRRTTRQVWQA